MESIYSNLIETTQQLFNCIAIRLNLNFDLIAIQLQFKSSSIALYQLCYAG